MGPLAGQGLITPEFDYILALLIGIGFGFVLEQAGFSSSKRLAGLFYGKDFVVLRVFFTAAITTVIGSIFLEYFGLLDMDLVYINPTFVWSSIIGGVIMGLGFIIGGFCPGTSLCAVSIGKIDAIFFVIGLIFGVFIFAELYTVFKPIYLAQDLGGIKIYDSLGTSRGLFSFLLIFMALAAFVVTFFIEQKINKTPQKFSIAFIKSKPYHTAAILITLLIGFVILFVPFHKDKLLKAASNQVVLNQTTFKEIPSIELAFKIVNNDKSIVIVDIRSNKDFAKFALPNSVNIPIEMLINREFEDFFGNITKKKIIIGNSIEEEKSAAVLLTKLGFKQIFILEGNLHSFTSEILNFTAAKTGYTKEEKDFLLRAKNQINQMIANDKKPKVQKKVLSKAKGGC